MIKYIKDILQLPSEDKILYTKHLGELKQIDAICAIFNVGTMDAHFINFDGTMKDCKEKVKEAIEEFPEISDLYCGCSIMEDDIVRPLNLVI